VASPVVLGQRALNRALLERQLLLRRVDRPALDTVEWLVGLQAQEPWDPYVALWTRVDGFRAPELADRLIARRLVRGTFYRGTIHLVSDADYLALRPVIQPMLERVFFRATPFGRALDGVDLDALLAFGRVLVEAAPATGTEVTRAVAKHWPDRDARSLSYAIQYLLPLIQVTPRAVWGKSGQARRTTAQAWLGRELARDAAPDGLFLRYLAAFGPAAPADFRAWSGLALPPETLDRLKPRLRTFRDERRRELFDVPDGPLPDPDTPAPVRFLPEYDNLTLGHDDRTRIVSEDDRRLVLAIAESGGPHFGGIIVDGFSAGIWHLERDRRLGAGTLVVRLLRPVSDEQHEEVDREAHGLVSLLTDAAEGGAVEYRPIVTGS
jgi:hypothetical protein